MSVSPIQHGANAAGTDQQSLFLKKYTGSFVSAPRAGLILFGGPGDRYIYRERPSDGKSFQFLMGSEVPEPEEYLPGEDLMGQAYAVEEGEIVTDNYIMCHKWLGKDRMDQAQYADRLLGQLGERHKNRIERLYDKRACITAALGARLGSQTKNGLNINQGGTRVTRTGETLNSSDMTTVYPLSTSGAVNLRADLRSLGLALDRKDIAPGYQNRGLIMDHYLRTVLTFDNTGQLFSRDYVMTNDQQKHEVQIVENFAIIGYANGTSRNGPLPNENIGTGPTKYQGNFSAGASNGIPGVLCFSRSNDGEYGLGMVEFEPIQHRVLWFEERLSWLVMTYMRIGCDVMHRWCLGSVEATNS